MVYTCAPGALTGSGWLGSGMWFWLVLMLLFWVIIIVVAIVLIRRFFPRSAQTPLDLAQERYVKGEISKQKYEEIKRELKRE